MQTAFDARVKAQDTERTRLEHTRQEAEKRAVDVKRERDTLAVELEDRFQIILSDDEAARVATVAELVQLVTARVGAVS